MEELLEAQAQKRFLLGFGIHSRRDGMNHFMLRLFICTIDLAASTESAYTIQPSWIHDSRTGV